MPTNTRSRMKATLVRFGPELYEDLRAEAQLAGVSIAEYVREAVVARMAYTAGRRGDAGYGQAAGPAAAAGRGAPGGPPRRAGGRGPRRSRCARSRPPSAPRAVRRSGSRARPSRGRTAA